MFNPIRTWLWRGPFTPLFRRFLTSSLPFASKWNMIAYIGSYYAIGSAWITTFANYFIIGWFMQCESLPLPLLAPSFIVSPLALSQRPN